MCIAPCWARSRAVHRPVCPPLRKAWHTFLISCKPYHMVVVWAMAHTLTHTNYVTWSHILRLASTPPLLAACVSLISLPSSALWSPVTVCVCVCVWGGDMCSFHVECLDSELCSHVWPLRQNLCNTPALVRVCACRQKGMFIFPSATSLINKAPNWHRHFTTYSPTAVMFLVYILILYSSVSILLFCIFKDNTHTLRF